MPCDSGHHGLLCLLQVAGMLVYYILSDGKHPFEDTKDREENIKKGQHSLEIYKI